MAETCLQACKFLATNIIDNPDMEKVRKLNLHNKHVDINVSRIDGGMLILEGMGFERNADQMVMEHVDISFLIKVRETLSLEL